MGWRRKVDESAPVDDSGIGAPGDPLLADAPHVADDIVLDELLAVFAVDARPGDDGDESSATSTSSTSAFPPSTPSSTGSGAPAIIPIGGDDLPDAVYLDDELASDSSAPVFIDDDGSSDAVMPKDASTRGIEPRLRQRRIGVKRAASRKRLWWIAIAAVVLVIVIGVLALLGSSLFAVDEVTVTGNVYTDPVALTAIVDDLKGTPVLLVDRADIESKVEAIPWVKDARVDTKFPNRASIDIRERTPVAAMQGADGQIRVIDSAGRVLAVVDGQPVALVWISGPGTLDLAAGQFAPIGYASVGSLVTKLTPEIRARVESVQVTPDGSDLSLTLTSPAGPIQVRFGSAIGENAQIEKLVRLDKTLTDLGEDPASVIDVSTADVTVR